MEAAKTKPRSKDVAYCRHCHDHLAGEVGVKVTDALISMGILARGKKEFSVTPEGKRWFAEKGIDVDEQRRRKRRFARQCVDWTERRHHLAGAMGASLYDYFLTAGWINPKPHSRAMHITDPGKRHFKNELGISV